MGFELSILFAFGAMLFWGFGDFLIQKTTRKIGDVESLAFIGIVGILILLPFIFNDIANLSLSNILALLLLGIVTFVAALFNFEALKKGKLSVVDVVIELELPITIFLGFLFFKEVLNIAQIAVISTIFIGIILMATKSFSHFRTRLEKGVLLALITAVGMGLINFLTANSSRAISPIMAVWAPWLIFTFFCIITMVLNKDFKKFIKNGIKFKWLILAMGLFDTIAWVFYAFATKNTEISITTAITESYPAIAMFLGIVINKEKIRWHQYLGAVFALGASFILGFLI